MRKILIYFAVILLMYPAAAKAGGTKSYIYNLAKTVSDWWGKGSIGSEEKEGKKEEKPAETTAAPGMCQVAQQPPQVVCEAGGGFLCVNTPEAGVVGDFIIIKGTIDRSGSVPASISVSGQHEYTKKTVTVETKDPETSDCWNSNLGKRPFCLDEKGFYAAKIPLGDLGPYTLAVGATRVSGGPVTETVRTSRVDALKMTEEQVAFDPDVRKTTSIDAPYVNVTVSLLGDCQHCDFIGASTFGVTVTVENVMTDFQGGVSRIGCTTNVEQGGQGKFMIGVPVGAGSNELKVTACNAATKSSCPEISGIKFQAAGGVFGIEIVSPPPLPAYSSSEYPTIPFEFKINGENTCVNVAFNRQPPVEMCGNYAVELSPQVGINVVTIDNDEKDIHSAWVFGWGDIASPFTEVESGRLVSKKAVQLQIPAATFTNVIGPMLTNILNSDELGVFIKDILQSPSGEEKKEGGVDVAIPQCEAGGLGEISISEIEAPQIGEVKVEGIAFEKDVFKANINADNLSVRFKLVKKDETLPLKMSFKKVVVELMLKVQKDGLVLLTSPYTDCDFKMDKFCKKTPAALVPKNFRGDATDYGGIVRCDNDSDVCKAFNSINAQTGLMNETVLDAVNSLIYCNGSKALTGLVKNGIGQQKFEIGYKDIVGPVELPVGFNFQDGLVISEKGLFLNASVIAGSEEFFSQMKQGLQIPSVGVLKGNVAADIVTNEDKMLGLGVAVDGLNHLLFVATALSGSSRGILDFDISETFFKRVGFDFIENCDAKKAKEGENPSALCFIRPRVSDMLGAALVKYGYFSEKQPLLVRIRSNPALAPHVSLVNEGEIPVVARTTEGGVASSQESLGSNLIDVQLGGLIMSFYAVEVDEKAAPDQYGNLQIKLDADGNPLIHSMRPEDPDPSNGQIASFEIALLLAVEIGDVQTNPSDPSELVLTIRPLADRSRLIISPVANSNATTIPPMALISSLKDKLQLAISNYSTKESALKIPLPKEISFDSYMDNEFVKLLGLKTITFGPDGLSLGFDNTNDIISLGITAAITQLLHKGGGEFQDTLPH